ncbi:MAG: DUF2478 domain-containing protein [Cystobacterineae bacterium]|nr:DUF2478 domain-containing protein [Cystobacterineae bacterium]
MRRQRAFLGVVAVVCLILQFEGDLKLSALSTMLWLLALALTDRPQLRRLWMPRFWMISILFALGSGLLLGKPDWTLGPITLSTFGLKAGALMVFRGVFLFALMGWASKLIVDKDIQQAIQKMGMAKFSNALNTAFGFIPSFAERARAAPLAGRGEGIATRFRRIYLTAVDLVKHAVLLAHSLETPTPFVAAVVGPPGSGKTTLIQNVAKQLRAEGFRLSGIMQPAIHEGGARVGYQLCDVASGEVVNFARRAEHGFVFANEGWAWARSRIIASSAAVAGSVDAVHAGAAHSADAPVAHSVDMLVNNSLAHFVDCLVLDELGRLEAKGEGHLLALTLPPSLAALLVAVRQDCADEISKRIGPFTLRVAAGAPPDEVTRFIEALRSHLRDARLTPAPPPILKEIEK